LDFFVMYSSGTVMLGNPGQANYVAANAALEAFARWRQAQGLAALAVAWGPIGDVGVLTTNIAAREALEMRLGEAPMKSAQALQALERLIITGASGMTMMPINAASLHRVLPDASSRRFSDLWRLSGSSPDDAVDDDLRAHLAQLSPEQAQQTIANMLAGEVATILRLQPNAVPYTRSLHELGLDSLMAVELGLALEKRVGVTLPPMLINDNPTVERIAARVLAGLFDDKSDTSAQVQLVKGMAVQHAETGLDADQMQALIMDVQDKAQAGTRLIA
jgi:acyl carrier protein